MRPATVGHAAVVALAVLLMGCGGTVPPVESSPSATAASTPPVSHPPLTPDLTGGTPLSLGSAGHWAIADGSAFVASAEGTVHALELATGNRRWQAGFRLGEPWDAQPTLGLSADRRTVIAVRTVDDGNAPALDLLLLDAASGRTVAEHLVTDPAGTWAIDLPPLILTADGATAVLADNPESGRQTAVITIADGSITWWVDDQAVAATAEIVVTRGGGWSRSDGTRLWPAGSPLGRLVQPSDALVVRSGSSAVWLDPATGTELARTADLGEAEPPCAAARTTLVCLGEEVTGYDLATGQRLWASPGPAEAVTGWAEWAYLWRAHGRGDVLDARTGEVLVTDAELPAIRFGDETGVLLSADSGYTWVPFPR